jgi:thioester reductase-like protein
MRKNLGLNDQQRSNLCQHLNIIINSAASVFKDEQLDLTVRVNVSGPLQLLKIAEDSPHFESFLQVSTCYANCEKTGFVEEQIYNNIKLNWRGKYDEILNLNKRDLIKNANELMLPFPNAYSFTKRMAEHLLINENKKDIAISFVRPSIIGAAAEEPCIGWTDTLGLISGASVLIGLGILKDMTGNENLLCDVIPVDYVGK